MTDLIRVEVSGWHTYDPIAMQYRWHPGERILHWSVDTDYDGIIYRPSLMHFAESARDRRILTRLAGKDADPDALDASFGLLSRPFPRPRSGQIAVRIVTDTGQTAWRVMSVPAPA